MSEHDDPKCDKCGEPMTTGMMAAFCPHQEQCAFWPENEGGVAFVQWVGGRRESPWTDAELAEREKGQR